MSAAMLLAQANGEQADDSGHFFDEFVDTITAPEAGDRIVDWVTTGIEWALLLAIFIVPALLLFGGAIGRRYGLAAGGLVGIVVMWWYRVRPEETVASGNRLFSTPDGVIQCRDAIVDSEDELVECSSGVVAQVRQNTVLDNWQIPVGDWVEQVVFWVDNNMKATLEIIEWPFRSLLRVIVDEWLLQMSWLTVCIAVFLLGWLFRNFQVGFLAFVGLLICGLLGEAYWRETALTIGFIGVAVILCVSIGIPIGVLCGRVDGAWKVVRPVLDAMQVVHSFVYMLPFIFFFGVGVVSATMVTMTFALPPLIRLTNLGIRQVPEDVVEASRAYGAPEWRVLTDVQLPLARPAIMTGLNQTLLLAISMLGIAAIMGAGGLGRLLFQAISNLDIAQAGSGGLAFFLVAVVLDRLSQPEAGDSGNLITRIAQAWRNRRTPENLLAEREEADASGSVPDAEPDAPDEAFVTAGSRERSAVIVTAVGAVVALVALLLPWNSDAGLVSAYARTTDVDLRTEQCAGNWVEARSLDPLAADGTELICDTGATTFVSNSFNGVSASGGSWFGIFLAILSAAALFAALNTLLRPGQGSRWLSAHGAVVFSLASLIPAVAYMFARPPDNVAELGIYSTGAGVYIAVIGTLIAAVGALVWVWSAPMTARRPLSANVGWGRLLGGSFAVLLLVMGGYAGWSFDTRAESVIDDELQAELDQIAAEGAAASEAARVAAIAADEAEAAGDLDLAQELQSEERRQLALEGVRAADIAAKIEQAQRQGDIIHDGFESEGAGLGIWTLIAGIAALGLSIPAIGLLGIDETFRYRWSTVVAGLGLGIAVVPLAWIVTIVRVADTNFVSGVGAMFVLTAGVTVFATARGTLSEFERNKIYGDIPVNSG
ncbi:ABC transporter permease [Candidatus Poriferisodalis sp.]|uniref:ABC transporter permease n=1 Tax=Candidatus Poriferisodalis sp. TaxID=3101277 RepID=UPI003B010455